MKAIILILKFMAVMVWVVPVYLFVQAINEKECYFGLCLGGTFFTDYLLL